MEERMTVCNMSIEAGARAGMIAPDETTYRLPRGPRRARPQGAAWERALARWRSAAERCRRALRSRGHDRRRGARADDHLRHQSRHGDPDRRLRSRSAAATRPSSAPSPTWASPPGQPLTDQKVNVVFIGSCTNARLVGPARGGRACCAGGKIAAGVHDAGGAGLAGGQAPGRGRGTRPRVPRRRRRVARVGLLDVPRHERRPGARAGSTPSAPATATSRAARGPAPAPCSPAR